MTKSKGEMKERRKPYRKPQVEQVELVPEEAVLGGCKNPNVAGPDTGPGCGGVLNQCYTLLFS